MRFINHAITNAIETTYFSSLCLMQLQEELATTLPKPGAAYPTHSPWSYHLTSMLVRIFYQHLTGLPQNHHVLLLVLQNLKSKFSEESDQNWRCYSSALLGLRAIKFGRPAVLGWMNLFLACSNFIFLKFWIYYFEVQTNISADSELNLWDFEK